MYPTGSEQNFGVQMTPQFFGTHQFNTSGAPPMYHQQSQPQQHMQTKRTVSYFPSTYAQQKMINPVPASAAGYYPSIQPGDRQPQSQPMAMQGVAGMPMSMQINPHHQQQIFGFPHMMQSQQSPSYNTNPSMQMMPSMSYSAFQGNNSMKMSYIPENPQFMSKMPQEASFQPRMSSINYSTPRMSFNQNPMLGASQYISQYPTQNQWTLVNSSSMQNQSEDKTKSFANPTLRTANTYSMTAQSTAQHSMPSSAFASSNIHNIHASGSHYNNPAYATKTSKPSSSGKITDVTRQSFLYASAFPPTKPSLSSGASLPTLDTPAMKKTGKTSTALKYSYIPSPQTEAKQKTSTSVALSVPQTTMNSSNQRYEGQSLASYVPTASFVPQRKDKTPINSASQYQSFQNSHDTSRGYSFMPLQGMDNETQKNSYVHYQAGDYVSYAGPQHFEQSMESNENKFSSFNPNMFSSYQNMPKQYSPSFPTDQEPNSIYQQHFQPQTSSFNMKEYESMNEGAENDYSNYISTNNAMGTSMNEGNFRDSEQSTNRMSYLPVPSYTPSMANYVPNQYSFLPHETTNSVSQYQTTPSWPSIGQGEFSKADSYTSTTVKRGLPSFDSIPNIKTYTTGLNAFNNNKVGVSLFTPSIYASSVRIKKMPEGLPTLKNPNAPKKSTQKVISTKNFNRESSNSLGSVEDSGAKISAFSSMSGPKNYSGNTYSEKIAINEPVITETHTKFEQPSNFKTDAMKMKHEETQDTFDDDKDHTTLNTSEEEDSQDDNTDPNGANIEPESGLEEEDDVEEDEEEEEESEEESEEGDEEAPYSEEEEGGEEAEPSGNEVGKNVAENTTQSNMTKQAIVKSSPMENNYIRKVHPEYQTSQANQRDYANADVNKKLVISSFNPDKKANETRVVDIHCIHRDPPIHFCYDFLSLHECYYVIRKSMEKANSSTEDKTNKSCSIVFERGESNLLSQIEQRLASFVKISPQYLEPLIVVNYSVGQSFYNQFYGDDRIVSAIVHLNNVQPSEGGQTYFPYMNLTIPAKRGSAMYWINRTEKDEEDHRLMHEPKPLKSGSKWVMYCHFNKDIMRP